MSVDQFALTAESSREKERHHGCAMDPDPAQLWLAGKFVSSAGGFGRVADIAAASQSTAGASLAAYPAHAEGAVADERAVIASGERCDRGDRAGDHHGDPGRGTRAAEVGGVARAGLQEERRRDREGADRDMARRASLCLEAIDGNVHFYTQQIQACDAEIERVYGLTRPDWDAGEVKPLSIEKRNSHSKNKPQDAEGIRETLEAHQRGGYQCGGWVWGVAGADGDHGVWHGHAANSRKKAISVRGWDWRQSMRFRVEKS